VDDRINGVGQAGYIFSVQDHATLMISCMTLAAYGTGSVGSASRQFAVGDVNYVDFRQFRGGAGVAANETSKVNIHSPGIYGDASRFAWAGDLSQVIIGGPIKIGDGLTFDVAFLSAFSNSVVSVYPSTIVGDEAMSGASYQCNDAIIRKNVTLPGGDVSYVGSKNCSVFGLAPDKAIVDDRQAISLRSKRNLSPRSKRSALRSKRNLIPRSKRSVPKSIPSLRRFMSYCATASSPCWRCLRAPPSGRAPSTSGNGINADECISPRNSLVCRRPRSALRTFVRHSCCQHRQRRSSLKWRPASECADPILSISSSSCRSIRPS
jgi:hypothetical protein